MIGAHWSCTNSTLVRDLVDSDLTVSCHGSLRSTLAGTPVEALLSETVVVNLANPNHLTVEVSFDISFLKLRFKKVLKHFICAFRAGRLTSNTSK